VSDVEIVARIERRRKWTIEEKAALIAETTLTILAVLRG